MLILGMARIVTMHDAAEAIRKMRPAHSGPAGIRPFIVGITGPVGAGKSTLAARLSPCIISTDHYLPDYERTPVHERDLPERADLVRLLADLTSLRTGKPTSIPQWSFHTHTREGELLMQPHEFVVVEGLHALHDTHAGALDVRIFVEASPAIRLARWENIARTGQRGWGVEETRSFFHNVAEPTFNSRADGYRAAAHLIVVNE
jgi:uridine kinase